jgi:hypothetical protein
MAIKLATLGNLSMFTGVAHGSGAENAAPVEIITAELGGPNDPF